ncbi:hypothetical protein [Thauera phenylacetica]|uniref:hypothetical protein n=1 Tax=Thauera phenylacetica TaxID=164400 RepID=UPI0012FABBE9|nr:hypothetical protein [Thauera phenylacetica]
MIKTSSPAPLHELHDNQRKIGMEVFDFSASHGVPIRKRFYRQRRVGKGLLMRFEA